MPPTGLPCYHDGVTDLGGDGSSTPAEPRRSQSDFDDSYRGAPPWDIGRPQPVFVELAERGAIKGRVLDAGCGTGEHVLMLAERGFDVVGVDSAPRAIAAAEQKAKDRRVAARFLVWDALRLGDLGERFETVTDSGLFHVFGDDERARYVQALGRVLGPGGTYLLCCFSDRQPGTWGPRRVSREEIRTAFGQGWTVAAIEETRFVTNLDPPYAEAWLATVVRT